MGNQATQSVNEAQSRAAISYPDGGYGWVCVVCCLLINALSWGVVASYGVYLAYYLSSNGFEDATSSDFAFIGGLNFAAAMAVTPFVSILSRRLGPRPPMLLGAIVLGGGFIAASFAERIWQLYLSQGMLVGMGVGFLYLPSINILPQWFQNKRSLASAVSSAGSGIGGLVFSFATRSMIEKISLPWAFRITGIVTAVANTVAIFLIKDRDTLIKPKYALFDTGLLQQTNVLLLLAWEVVMLFGYITVQFSLSDFGMSVRLSGQQSDAITAILNVGTACGRPFIGFLSDRFGRIRVTMILTLLTGLLCFATWVPATNFGVSALFAILVGGIYGVFWAAIGPLAAELVGIEKLPSLLSLAWLTAIIPTAVAEYLVLKMKRSSNSRQYLYAQIFAALAFTIASVFLWLIEVRTYRQKRRLSIEVGQC